MEGSTLPIKFPAELAPAAVDLAVQGLSTRERYQVLEEYGLVDVIISGIQSGFDIGFFAKGLNVTERELLMLIRSTAIGRLKLRTAKLSNVADHSLDALEQWTSVKRTEMFKEEKAAMDFHLSIVKEVQNGDLATARLDTARDEGPKVVVNNVIANAAAATVDTLPPDPDGVVGDIIDILPNEQQVLDHKPAADVVETELTDENVVAEIFGELNL